ncbi:hypothetical protein ElyMa_004477800 [Elysia marginata]|uniref:Uncharacterized protein n=1 Tax=Elysia marginata TaxID=1093978 RepID=A0AAV4HGP5_9GAST|nr:hypothetical protein ElyMa_004477800 [Elysia marginata]
MFLPTAGLLVQAPCRSARILLSLAHNRNYAPSRSLVSGLNFSHLLCYKPAKSDLFGRQKFQLQYDQPSSCRLFQASPYARQTEPSQPTSQRSNEQLLSQMVGHGLSSSLRYWTPHVDCGL